MLEESEVPKHVKMAPYGPSTFIQKPFRFDELEAQWKAFTAMLLKNGEPFASFLNTVNAVRTEGRRLALITDQPFYREWIMEETNRKALNNLISYYTDAPKGFELEVEVRKKEGTEAEITAICGKSLSRGLISLRKRRIRWTGKENGRG